MKVAIDLLKASERIVFLQDEANYWKAEAGRLRTKLAEIEDAAQRGQYQRGADLPPEPPDGTAFYSSPTATKPLWQRTGNVWRCGYGHASGHVFDWRFVIEDRSDALRYWHRALPGGTS